MYIEENIKTKIVKKYDVAVCGGGFAGISAALASARQGKKTVLFEKQYMLGGLGKAGYKLNTVGVADIPDEEKNEENKVELLNNQRFSGLSGEELSKQMCLSHRSTLNDLEKRRKEDATIVPVTLATTPQVRMTRKIIGEYVLSDKEMHTYFEDSIGMVSDWKKRGPVYEIPFRTLYSSKVKNLICAGRCTSVNETMWDIMRVIPCCAVTGQAAGTAAAMTDDFGTLDVLELQKKLVESGVVLHEKEIM